MGPVGEPFHPDEPEFSVDVIGKRWGLPVSFRLPDTPFVTTAMRLTNDEVIQIGGDGDAVGSVLTPSLSRASVARLQGLAGIHRRSAKVSLHHTSDHSGVAIETPHSWECLDGSSSIEVSRLRTNRIVVALSDRDFNQEEARLMEGTRVIARPRKFGTILSECSGLGASLWAMSGSHNDYGSGLRAARAVLDTGTLRNVSQLSEGTWTAQLPFSEPISYEHCLWSWSSGSDLPEPVPREYIKQDGSSLTWDYAPKGEVFGWAFSFRGNRVGSVCLEPSLPQFSQHLNRGSWTANAAWLRCWHCPVFHPAWCREIKRNCLSAPVETCAAWLLPDFPEPSMHQDEASDEAWAAVCRELLWRWDPTISQAKDLVQRIGIWSGDTTKDTANADPEVLGRLLRCNPVLLAKSLSKAAKQFYNYPKPQLVFLIKLLLEAINPHALEADFDLRILCDQYSHGDKRLDGGFIFRRLVDDGRSMFRGHAVDPHNLQIAFHSPGLRDIVGIALLRDIVQAWQSGEEGK